jgi:hypothetical protein
MKARGFLKKIAWVLAFLAALAVLAGIDWFPTLKELNRLQRDEREFSLQTGRLESSIGRFVFPAEKEKLIFSETEQRLLESLPRVADDASWLAMVLSDLRDRARRDRLDSALLLIQAGPGQPAAAPLNLTARASAKDLLHWLTGQCLENGRCLQAFADSRRFPWRNVLGSREFSGTRRLACRTLGIAVAAKLPALLNFVNHCSWLAGRLEIVQLSMGQGETRPLALIFCRAYYLVSTRSGWPIAAANGRDSENLLVDADSALLWQPVDPGGVGPASKNELPPMRDTELFRGRKN